MFSENSSFLLLTQKSVETLVGKAAHTVRGAKLKFLPRLQVLGKACGEPESKSLITSSREKATRGSVAEGKAFVPFPG